MCSVLKVELSILTLFEAPTVAELAQHVQQALHSEQGVIVPPLVPMPRAQAIPLSFAQQRLWVLEKLEPGNIAYLVPRVRRLRGVLQVRALAWALDSLVRRHEILRTTFQEHGGQPAQVIHAPGPVALPLHDLRGLAQADALQHARRLIEQELHQPCDLARGPLLRACLLRVQDHEHVLLLTMHHSISDAWSRTILFEELLTCYRASVQGRPHALPALPIQYADYASWQRQWLQGAVLEAQLAYWRRHLQGVTTLDLPTDHPHPALQSFRGAQMTRELAPALHAALMQVSLREQTTLFMTLLAGFQVLLARVSGQQDIAVGTPIANRSRAEVEGLIGFFTNTLVLRTDLSGDPSFREVLGRVREVALGGYSHQEVPFERLVEELQPARDLGRTPLFQVMFLLQHATAPREQVGELVLEGFAAESVTAKFDLTCSVVEGRSEEHTSELQSRQYLVCRLLLEKKKETTLPGYDDYG